LIGSVQGFRQDLAERSTRKSAYKVAFKPFKNMFTAYSSVLGIEEYHLKIFVNFGINICYTCISNRFESDFLNKKKDGGGSR
jgi:hypothetical protein